MKVYLAGKVAKHDWRHEIVGLWELSRATNDGEDWSDCHIQGNGTTPLGWHEYVGPFFTGCDHGCGHGKRLHGNASPESQCLEAAMDLDGGPHGGAWDPDNCRLTDERQRFVFRNCCAAIDRSDFVFAWMKDRTAFGTLWELGYAAAQRKRIVIATADDLDVSELWFSLQSGEHMSVSDPVAGFVQATRKHDLEQTMTRRMESPIERQLFGALRIWFDTFGAQAEAWLHGRLRLVPQVDVCGGRYRVDFGIYDPAAKWKLAIECDGHDFHEKTKEQAQRDKSRDRDIVNDGWTIIRFTGSEIHRDARKCAADALGTALTLAAREAGRV